MVRASRRGCWRLLLGQTRREAHLKLGGVICGGAQLCKLEQRWRRGERLVSAELSGSHCFVLEMRSRSAELNEEAMRGLPFEKPWLRTSIDVFF